MDYSDQRRAAIEGHYGKLPYAEPQDPYQAFIHQRFRYHNRRPEPDLIQEYVQRLNFIPLDELQAVWQMLEPSDGTNYMPNCNALIAAWYRREKQKKDDAPVKAEPIYGEKATAKQVCRSLFSSRLINGFIRVDWEHKYHGEFDCHHFVDHIELEHRKDNDITGMTPEQIEQEHRARVRWNVDAWNMFNQRFEEAWHARG